MDRFSYEKWDKISPVNDIPASEWLGNNFHLRNGDVYLIKDCNVVSYIESIDCLKRSYNIVESTDEDVLAEFIKLKELDLDRNDYYFNEYNATKKELFQTKLILMKEGLI